jgi:GxxExxY protein
MEKAKARMLDALEKEASPLLESELTRRVIGVFFGVYNEMGPGFLESVYVNALMVAFAEAGIEAQTEVPLTVKFRGHVVGQFRADLVVEKRVIVEVKALSSLERAHEAQLVNYLRATGVTVGLLLNFGPVADFKRRVCTLRSNPLLSA